MLLNRQLIFRNLIRFSKYSIPLLSGSLMLVHSIIIDNLVFNCLMIKYLKLKYLYYFLHTVNYRYSNIYYSNY